MDTKLKEEIARINEVKATLEEQKKKEPGHIYEAVLCKCDIPFGKIDVDDTGQRIYPVSVHLEVRGNVDGETILSLMCFVWNSRRTDCIMSGQCFDAVSRKVTENRALWDEIMDLWRTYHLNDCKHGTPEQYACLADRFKETGGRGRYEDEVEYLKSVGKYEVEWHGKTVTWGKEHIYWKIPEKTLERIGEIIQQYY
jgi:hypothetical protein